MNRINILKLDLCDDWTGGGLEWKQGRPGRR